MSNWCIPLARAVLENDLDRVKKLIPQSHPPDSVKWPSDALDYFPCDLLVRAIALNHTEIAKELLIRGISVNNPSKSNYFTPLHAAVKRGNVEITEMLLKRNADVFALYRCDSPLDFAAHNNNLRIAKRLLDHVAYLNSVPNRLKQVYGCGPIFRACEKNFNELVELFLSRGTEISINSTEKTELLIRATKLKNKNLVILLVKDGVDIFAEAKSTTALRAAVMGEDLMIIESMLKSCPNIDGKGNMHIRHLALEVKHSRKWNKIVNVLLNYGFTVRPEDATDGELLATIVEKVHLEILKILIEYGADVNASHECLRNSTFLQVAVVNRRFEMAKMLIESGADVNVKCGDRMKPPIYSAVRNLDEAMTELLLSSGAVIENMCDLLPLAFQYNGEKIVETLLRHDTKFDINTPDGRGSSVLYNLVAREYNHNRFLTKMKSDFFKAQTAELCLRRGVHADFEIIHDESALNAPVESLSKVVEMLMKYGAEVDFQNYSQENMTPLMNAIKKNDLSMVRSLVDFFPDTEITDTRRQTALHYGARYGSPTMIQELLDYGADINAMSDDNETPYTIINCHDDCTILLKKHIYRILALDRWVNSENLQDLDFWDDVYKECRQEVKKMKCTKISKSMFSFYNVLTNGTKTLTACVENEEIVKALSMRDNYANIFPIYSAMIYYHFVKFTKLKPLLASGMQSLGSLISFELPYPVSMELLSYLSITDLRNLTKASPATDSLTRSQ